MKHKKLTIEERVTRLEKTSIFYWILHAKLEDRVDSLERKKKRG